MPSPRPGTTWAGYRIDAETGSRGPVRWYAAHDADGRAVVLQVVVAEGVDAEAHDRIAADARAAAALEHPHLVPVLDVVDQDGDTVVVTADVGGSDLRSELLGGPTTLAGGEAVATQIGAALDCLHAAGLVHGDVSPVHVLRDAESGALLLSGVGCHHALAFADEPVLRHVAPEQVRGEAPGPPSDVYGLGCTVFECLTGRVPFPAESVAEISRRHLHDVPPAVTVVRPDRPAGLDAVMGQALAKDPGERHPSGAAFAEALVDARYTPPPSLPRTGSPDVTTATTAVVPVPDDWLEEWGPDWDEEGSSKLPWIVAGTLTVLVAVVGLLVWRAVNTEATLDAAAAPTTTTTEPIAAPAVAPTPERAQELVPPGVEACAPAAEQPTDAPPRVVLQCPNQQVPELVTLTLFADLDSRDAAFDDAAEALDPVSGQECALGGPAVHDYIGVAQVGRVACRQDGTRVDFVWTSSESPLLAEAGGQGRFAEHYDFWAASVDRVDGAFPLPEERALLERLPAEQTERCRRELGLAERAGAELALSCEPEGVIPERIAYLSFPTAAAMDAWIRDRPAASTQPAVAVAGTCPRDDIADYTLDGTPGRVACRVDGRAISLTWVREDLLLGSIASADATPVRTMDALIEWWYAGGHRP